MTTASEPTAVTPAPGQDNSTLESIDAWWRAANYLSVGQIYLRSNPLLRRPLAAEDVKARLLGPVPGEFPQGKEDTEVSYEYMNFSNGSHASEGGWASGEAPDGIGTFSYNGDPYNGSKGPQGTPTPPPTHPDPRLYGTTDESKAAKKAKSKIKNFRKDG